jgi:hypothetical protein
MKFLTALLSLALPLHAASESREIEASFYCFKYVPGLETIEVRAGESQRAVRLSTANITPSERLMVTQGVASLHGKSAAASGQPSPSIVGKVKIPDSIQKALIVMIPAAANAAEPYHCVVLDQDQREFPLGTYRVINISPFPIRGAIGKSYVEAKPGAITGLALQGSPGTILPARFEYSENSADWSRLTETRCAVRDDRRWILCVYQDPKTKRMNMRSIPDRTTIVAAVEEAAEPS